MFGSVGIALYGTIAIGGFLMSWKYYVTVLLLASLTQINGLSLGDFELACLFYGVILWIFWKKKPRDPEEH